MNKLDNLKPAWKPGQSGNPNGRPPGTFGLTNILRETINNGLNFQIYTGELINEKNEPTGKTVRIRVQHPTGKAIASKVLKMAAKGNMRAIEFVFDRLEGKQTQPIEVENKPVIYQPPEALSKMSNKQLIEQLKQLENET